LNINEDDVRRYDEAIANTELQKRLDFSLSREIEKIKSTTIIAQRSEQFQDCSDETVNFIKSYS
jgi:hypothetical protein